MGNPPKLKMLCKCGWVMKEYLITTPPHEATCEMCGLKYVRSYSFSCINDVSPRGEGHSFHEAQQIHRKVKEEEDV